MALSQFRPTAVNDGGSTKKTTTTTTTSDPNAGTKKYIEQMEYAANEAKKQKALDQLKAAQDKDTAKEKAEHAQLGNGTVNPPGNNPPGNNPPGNSGNKGSGSGVNVSLGSGGNRGNLSGFLSGLLGNQNQTTPPIEITPDTTVEDSYKASMEAANERLKQAYEYQQGLLSKAKDDALREAYIKQQMVERGYPEQLSAAGINGGAAQALLARNNADYAKQRGSIQGNYMNNLGEAGQNYQQGVLQNNQNFLEIMAAYRQQLDEMRRKWELEHLEKSGLLKTTANGVGNRLGGLGNLFGDKTLTPQEYLNNLRTNYGNLFK